MIKSNTLETFIEDEEWEIDSEGEVIEDETCIVAGMGMRYDFLKTFMYAIGLSFYFLFITIWPRARIRELSKASVLFENMGSYMNRMAYYYSKLEKSKERAEKC
jgi:hypothetical protein|tara:strand:- start:485 stop:796 length:312 start_codon:yes stop_codon:yes gene_type:complete